jgi:acyl carrier protein
MTDNLIRLQNVVSKQLGIDPTEIQPGLDFGDDLGAESLDVVELIMAIEDEFEIDIEDQVANKIRTIEDALDYIQKQKDKY